MCLTYFMQGLVQDGGLNRNLYISQRSIMLLPNILLPNCPKVICTFCSLYIVQRLGGTRSVMKDSIGWI